MILERITSAGHATDNVAFGMGDALLQQLNRDTQKFALKTSSARVDGKWIEVYKDPATDKGKQSKRGRLTLLHHVEYDTYKSVALDGHAPPLGFQEALVDVWRDGKLLADHRLEDVRTRADAVRL